MKQFILLLATLISAQYSPNASADDLIAYLIAKAPTNSSTELVQNLGSLSLSNCLQLADLTHDIIVVRVHCNEIGDLHTALIHDIYPLLSVHLKSQWFETAD